jgi:ABC-type multidrug transport system ATPase subunit
MGTPSAPPLQSVSAPAEIGSRTIVYRVGAEQLPAPPVDPSGAKLLFQRNFDGKQKLSVGRGPDNDIQLDGLLISKHHAQFINTPQGILVEEAGSTNGVYVNGGRVTNRQPLSIEDIVQIGPFVLRADPRTGIAIFDTRAKTRIDAIGITQVVPKASGQGSKKLLDNISLAIAANEFVGVLGPSGAGKSTLINALNGMRQTTNGRVLINNLELYQHIDSLKQSIGYVPQDDIIHRELTVYRTLYYVARLRLSRDVPKNEIDQIIAEVLEVTGLTARRDVLVSQLSGGQRKRVSIAVELITKPSVIFLDEPTSGLDPATEERIMKLFRQIAESGRTVILTTHAMENVRLFDKVVLLMGGKLIFYGTPDELLKFVGAGNFIELYNKIEEPIDLQTGKLGPMPSHVSRAEQLRYESQRAEIAEAVAEDWHRRYMATETYIRYVSEPLSQVQREAQNVVPPRRRRSLTDALLQWVTLLRRYAEVLASDKWNLLILFGQAPIIAVLTYLVVGKNDPRDFPFFILTLVSIWFGTSVAARELVKENAIFRRERMVNLRLLSYVGSKLVVLSIIVGLQTALLFLTLKALDLTGLMSLPGVLFGVPQLLVLALTGVVGITLGLFVSAIVKTSEVATSIVPLILIPQILFAGLVGVPTGVSRIIGAAMPATWSFDEIKRLSTADTLREEGSDPTGPNKGRGLLNHTKDVNSQNIKAAREALEKYRQQTTKSVEDYARQMSELATRSYSRVAPPVATPLAPQIGPVPPVPDAVEVGDDLSGYVSFMHPWGGHIINVAVLIAMLCGLFIATLTALKTRDTV